MKKDWKRWIGLTGTFKTSAPARVRASTQKVETACERARRKKAPVIKSTGTVVSIPGLQGPGPQQERGRGPG